MEDQSELTAYVTELERRYDASVAPEDRGIPEPDDMVRELENFLRSQRGSTDAQGDC